MAEGTRDAQPIEDNCTPARQAANTQRPGVWKRVTLLLLVHHGRNKVWVGGTKKQVWPSWVWLSCGAST